MKLIFNFQFSIFIQSINSQLDKRLNIESLIIDCKLQNCALKITAGAAS